MVFAFFFVFVAVGLGSLRGPPSVLSVRLVVGPDVHVTVAVEVGNIGFVYFVH